MPPSRPRVSALWLAVCLTAAGVVSACGYTVGTDVEGGGTQSARTVAIVPFANQVAIFERRPGVEQHLHAALLDVVLPSPYMLVPPDEADLLVTGQLLRLEQRTLSQTTAGAVSEVQVRIVVEMHVESRRTGRDWSDTIHANEVFAVGGGETLEQTETRAFRHIAREILRRFVPPQNRWTTEN